MVLKEALQSSFEDLMHHASSSLAASSASYCASILIFMCMLDLDLCIKDAGFLTRACQAFLAAAGRVPGEEDAQAQVKTDRHTDIHIL
jgi:hypothetical protein